MTDARSPASQAGSRNIVIQSAIFIILTLVSLPFIVERVSTLGASLDRQFRGRYSGDFYAFYGAGILYNRSHDGSAYDLDQLRAVEYAAFPVLHDFPNWVGGEVTPFRNPPFFLPVVGYFGAFPAPLAYQLMAAVNTLLLGTAAGLTGVLATRKAAPLAAIAWGGLVLAAYSSWHGLFYSQLPSYIAVVGLTLAILALRRDQQILGGLAFAVLAIKPQYAVPILVFLAVTRRWDAVFGFVTGGAILAAVSLAIVGPEGIAKFVANTAEVSFSASYMYGNVFEEMYNWRAVLHRLFRGNMVIVGPLQIALTLATYALAIWAWRASRRLTGWRADMGYVVLLLLMLLASPHAHAQDVILLVPAAALVARYLWSEQAPWPWTAISAAALFVLFWFLPMQEILGPLVHPGVLVLGLLFGLTVYVLRSGVVERLSGLWRTDDAASVRTGAEPTTVEDAPPAS
jgi:hypothetical protein